MAFKFYDKLICTILYKRLLTYSIIGRFHEMRMMRINYNFFV